MLGNQVCDSTVINIHAPWDVVVVELRGYKHIVGLPLRTIDDLCMPEKISMLLTFLQSL